MEAYIKLIYSTIMQLCLRAAEGLAQRVMEWDTGMCPVQGLSPAGKYSLWLTGIAGFLHASISVPRLGMGPPV